MSGAIPPLPNTPSRRGAQLKHRANFVIELSCMVFEVGNPKYLSSQVIIFYTPLNFMLTAFSEFKNFSDPRSRASPSV
jgi:hypothetical protein